MKEFLKSTIIGGLLFLLPVALILFLLGYAVYLVTRITQPVLNSLHLGRLSSVAVVALAVLMLVLVSFVAGIAARTEIGARITIWLEKSLLGGVPQYQLLKGMAQGFARVESASGVKPVMVSIEGGWRIGYLLETLENGWFAVFLPQAPTAMSGEVMYLPIDRVRPLNLTMGQAMSIVSSVGLGSRAALRGVDMTPS